MEGTRQVGLLKADAACRMAEKDPANKKESVAPELYQKCFAVLSAQANLYSVRWQHAAVLATWRYLTGRPVAAF